MTRSLPLFVFAVGVACVAGCSGSDEESIGMAETDNLIRPESDAVAADDPEESDEEEERGAVDTPHAKVTFHKSGQSSVHKTKQVWAQEDPEVVAFLEMKGWKASSFPTTNDGNMILLAPQDTVTFKPLSLELSEYEKIGKSKRIEWLVLDQVAVDAAGIAKLAGMPRLKSLVLGGESVTNEVLSAAATIETLEIVEVKFAKNATDAGFAKLAKLPRLWSLRLYGCTVGPDVIPAFEGVALRRLSVNDCAGLTDDVARQIAKLRTIEDLALGNTLTLDGEGPLTREGLRAIVASYVPRKLRVNAVLLDDDILGRLLAAGWAPGNAGGATKATIRHVNLRDSGVTDAGFAPLLGCPNVEALHIGTTNLTDACFMKFPGAFPKLRSLSIEQTKVTAAGFEALVELPLKTLYLQECNLTQEMLIAVGKMNGLEWLNLEGCEYEPEWLEHLIGLENLTYINLGKTGFDDNAAERVARLPRLEQIDVDETELGDEGFQKLVAVPHLKELSVNNTNVTKDVYLKSKADNPKKWFHYRRYD